MVDIQRVENLELARVYKKKLKNMITDIRSILKDSSKTAIEKNNLIYNITVGYEQ